MANSATGIGHVSVQSALAKDLLRELILVRSRAAGLRADADDGGDD
ncbi:hypothetical protein RSSM_02540 [Rhodopirellula sallentina SM41]|uniref:Uncharacterized protein n=1 Tax=Rhodopirellula sallentina SM41 TaxID=1263870 RepID=M5U3L1_9BACT|nr:hypothetical protein RSSM_02540 [Rhodopirellula sallentina SM41]